MAGTEMKSPFTEKIRQMSHIANLSTSSPACLFNLYGAWATVMKELKKFAFKKKKEKKSTLFN